jgi:hypothetical protein
VSRTQDLLGEHAQATDDVVKEIFLTRRYFDIWIRHNDISFASKIPESGVSVQAVFLVSGNPSAALLKSRGSHAQM